MGRTIMPESGLGCNDRTMMPESGSECYDRTMMPESGSECYDRTKMAESGFRCYVRALVIDFGFRFYDRIRYTWRDFIQNFFSGRLLVFCVFQFSILHYYGDSVRQYAVAVNYPAAPWILPFMGQNVYFQFIYGISAIYFYSNVPFLQRYEMYALMRQGKGRWASAKLIRIWLSAVMLVSIEFVLSILPLIPRLEWTSRWGKLYHSLALTDAGAACNVRLFFPYELLNANNALTTILMLFLVLCLATGLTGTLMFALSICFGRTVAIMGGTFLAILAVVFENLHLWKAWVGFLSPFSWMNLLLLYGKGYKTAPSFWGVCLESVGIMVIAGALSVKAVKGKDLNWIEEE